MKCMDADPFPFFGLFNGRWGGWDSSILLGEKCCEIKDSLRVVRLLRVYEWPTVEKLCVAKPTVEWRLIPKTLLWLTWFK